MAFSCNPEGGIKISQREIISFLKKNKDRWWFGHEICFFCRNISNKENTSKYLKRLREHGEIEIKPMPKNLNHGNGRFMYKYKEDDINEII